VRNYNCGISSVILDAANSELHAKGWMRDLKPSSDFNRLIACQFIMKKLYQEESDKGRCEDPNKKPHLGSSIDESISNKPVILCALGMSL